MDVSASAVLEERAEERHFVLPSMSRISAVVVVSPSLGKMRSMLFADRSTISLVGWTVRRRSDHRKGCHRRDRNLLAAPGRAAPGGAGDGATAVRLANEYLSEEDPAVSP
jgi:hypothetical protein